MEFSALDLENCTGDDAISFTNMNGLLFPNLSFTGSVMLEDLPSLHTSTLHRPDCHSACQTLH